MIKNEKGYTLVTVLLVILLLTVVGGAYIFAMNFEVRESFRHDHRVQAYYFGRSGAEAASEWFMANQGHYLQFDDEGNIEFKEELPENISEDLIIEISGNLEEEGLSFSEPAEGDNVEIEIQLGKVISNKKVTIESVGRYSAARERVILDLNLSRIKGSAFDNAVYSYGDVDASQPPGIRVFEDENGQGGVESAGGVDGQERIEGGVIEYSYRYYSSPTVFFQDYLDDEDAVWETISAGNNDIEVDKTPGEVYYYDEISSQPNGTITFHLECSDVEGEDHITLFINELDSKGVFNTTCDCPGPEPDCFVVMYVRGDATIQTPNAGNEVPIFLYLEDGASLDLIAGSSFNGYIYGPYATVKMISNTHIDGAIIVNELIRNWQQDAFIGTIQYERIEIFDEYFEHLGLEFYTRIGVTRGLWK